MKLADAVEFSPSESRIACQTILVEDGEGPRWKFDYHGRRVTDPSPDILLLGAYRHPNTGNNLVGGINLHYLSQKQRNNLAKALPKIMHPGNLKQRYWTGRELVPDVFDNYYRTYNASFIRGVQKDIMYPKYGFLKAAKDYLKKTIGGIFKSKERRKKEAEPKYPDDLTAMQDRLDQAVNQLQQEPSDEPEDTPEMQAARTAFQQFQRERSLRDIQRREQMPFDQAYQDIQNQSTPQPTEPQPEPKEPEPQPDPRKAQRELEQLRRNNQNELENPENEIDPNIDLEESIVYYSPLAGHYVVEPAYELVSV